MNKNKLIGVLRVMIIFIGLFILVQEGKSQQVEYAIVQRVEDDLVVTFNLVPKESVGELYQITVTAHYGGNSKEMKVKEGSLSDVRPGNHLQFVFSGRENLKNVKGEVDFSITAKMTFSPIRFISPNGENNGKRGKPMNIEWRGGLDQDQYALVLDREGTTVETIDNELKDSTYQWDIPLSTKPGKNYQLKLISANNPDQTTISTQFSIKRKVPLVFKIAPAAILGGAAYFLIKGSGSGDSGGDSFPNPPDLPEL